MAPKLTFSRGASFGLESRFMSTAPCTAGGFLCLPHCIQAEVTSLVSLCALFSQLQSSIWTQLLELVLASGLCLLDYRVHSGKGVGRSGIAEARRVGYVPLGTTDMEGGEVEPGV